MKDNYTYSDVVTIILNYYNDNLEIFTTLDVKNELREQGFYATQKNVSIILNELCEELNLTKWYNGEYNEYELGEISVKELYEYLSKYSNNEEIVKIVTTMLSDIGIANITPISKEIPLGADGSYQLTYNKETIIIYANSKSEAKYLALIEFVGANLNEIEIL